MNNSLRYFRQGLVFLVLPTLGLTASYGVFRFMDIFVPTIIAVVGAASFELTYIGLALKEDLSIEAKRLSERVSLAAVCVSIIYNALDVVFVLNPEYANALFLANTLGLWVIAFIHGAPLAVIAFYVSKVVLHNASETTKEEVKATVTNATFRISHHQTNDYGRATPATGNIFVIPSLSQNILPQPKREETIITTIEEPKRTGVIEPKKPLYTNGRSFSSADYRKNYCTLVEAGLTEFSIISRATELLGCAASVTRSALDTLIENDLLFFDAEKKTYYVNTKEYDRIRNEREVVS